MTNKKLKTAEKQARKKAKNPDELLEQLRSEIILRTDELLEQVRREINHEIMLRIDVMIQACSFLMKSAKEQGVKLDWKNSRERKAILPEEGYKDKVPEKGRGKS